MKSNNHSADITLDLNHPDTPLWLMDACPSALALYFIPTGGERHGILSISSIACSDVRNELSVYAYLWKLGICLLEEWPYEPWTSEIAAGCWQGSYQNEHAASLIIPELPTNIKGALESLRDAAVTVINAQSPSENPMNAPAYHPSKGSVLRSGILRLDFVTPEALLAVVSTRWNQLTYLFTFESRYVMIEWSTNA